MIAGIIVPGRGYGPQAPLLSLADEALTDLGGTIETITWTVPDGLLDVGPEPFVRATAAITRNPAPALLVGGTQDRTWIPDAATRTGKTVLTIEGANHGLRPPGSLRAYTDALGVVGTEMEKFLSQLTRPPRRRS